METNKIEQLRELAAASGLVAGPQIGDGFVFGRAHLSAACADVDINLDPEIEDGGADAGGLVTATGRFLSIMPAMWRTIIEAIAAEVEEAVGGVSVVEAADLRDDLDIRSVVVFADTILLSFAAEKQFPDSWIRVQLGDAFEVEDITVDGKE